MADIEEAVERDWHLGAACRGLDPDLFFPATSSEEARAKIICAGCPVRSDCLDFAMRARERYGVWGGTSEEERKAIHARSKKRELIDASPR